MTSTGAFATLGDRTGVKANPYAISKTVNKTSLKSLTAKITSSKPAIPITDTESNLSSELPDLERSPEIICDSGDDVDVTVIAETRSSPKRRTRSNTSDLLREPLTSPATKTTKKKRGRQSKKDKTKADNEKRRLATLQQAKSTLVNSLDDLEDDVAVSEDVDGKGQMKLVVIWGNHKLSFSLTKNDTLEDVFQQVAQAMDSTVEEIIIFHSNNPSLQLLPLDCCKDIQNEERIFLSAPKDKACVTQVETVEESPSTTGIPSDCILYIYMQSTLTKGKVRMELDTRKPLKEVMSSFANMVGKNVKKLRFTFDGDVLDGKKRPEDLDMEGDEVIDVVEL